MVRGSVSKLILVDSSVGTHHDKTKVFLPPQAFSATGEEKIGLTLLQFGIKRNFYNINSTNNAFFIEIASTLHLVVIPPGVYTSFTSLTTALNTALTATIQNVEDIASILAEYDATTRFFTITVTMADGKGDIDVAFKCFAIKDGILPATVGPSTGFNDSHEILGGLPVKEANSTVQSLNRESKNVISRQQIFKSFYPASLNTLDAIYLHLSALEMGTYASTGYNFQVVDDPRLVESSIFARIPLDTSFFNNLDDFQQYTDTGSDLFEVFPTRKNLEQLEIKITDAKGRSLTELDKTQADYGTMKFKMVLRFDIFKPPPQQALTNDFKKLEQHAPRL